MLRGQRTGFHRDYTVYSGYFGSPIQGFPMTVDLRREATEHVLVAAAEGDPGTDDAACEVRERSCMGTSPSRDRGGRSVGFSPTRRLGPVRVGYDSLGDTDFHSCDRGTSNPLQNLRAARGRRNPGPYPVVQGSVPFARFRKRIVRFTLKARFASRAAMAAGMT